MKKRSRGFYLVGLSLLFVFLFSLSGVSAWTLSGFVFDDRGNVLNNTNVTIGFIYAPGGGAPTIGNSNTTQSNSSGYFILTVPTNDSRSYRVSLKHFNSTTNRVDFVGQSLPFFPNMMFASNLSINFSLRPAGTINITAINSSGNRINFNYQIKDSDLGYTIEDNWNSGGNGASEANAYLPLNKNYSIMLYPRSGGMPLTYSWTNFSATEDYNLDSLSSYNKTTKVLKKQFNTTVSLGRFTGYVNGSSLGITGWDNLTIIPMILESGRFIFLQHSAMPYNMSSWIGQSDVYNYSSGFYNITLPGPAESQTILIYVSAQNGSEYYGSYQNISISYGQAGSYNFTMYGLLGSSLKNISMGQQPATNILTKMMALNLVNASDNQTLVNTGIETHVEVVLDYSSVGVSEIAITDSVSGSGSAIFYLPMLNISGSKEINVFSNSFAPKRVDKKTAAQILANNNISLSSFSPRTRDGRVGSQIDMVMITSNSSCDVPAPSINCYKGDRSGSVASFNPITTILGGGKISFRMGYGNVSVHYVNVDMIASGPPDASFDSQGTESISTTFQSLMKFGSQGPKIYDYVLVSMPYDEKILKEFQPVNISIPLLYDEDWNVIWNVTANGTNPSSLSGNYSHYVGKESQWGNLTQSKTCTTGTLTNANQINETNPCYIDTTRNKIWLRIPHFSGTEPQVSGTTSLGRYTFANGIDYKDVTETSGSYINRNNILINVTSNISNFNNLTIWIYNSTKAINITNISTDPSYSMNISGLSDGLWFFNATVFNDTGAFNSTDLRNVTIDTINPTLTNLTSYDVNNSVVNRDNIYINMNSSDTNIANITIRLYNSSLTLINSSTATSSNNSINFTGLSDADGLYYYDAIAYDLAGNSNTSSLRQVILNVSSPVVNSASASVSTTTATVSYTSNKSVNATISYGTSNSLGNSGTAITSFGSSGSFSLTGLSASTTYYYNITICDRAGACVTNGTNSFTTSAATTSASSSSSGGPVYSVPVAVNLESGYTKLMTVAEQLKFNLGTESHSVFVQSLIGEVLTLKVSSTPQIVSFKVGEEKNLELTGDNYYDLYIKFNSIKSGAANVTIKKINLVMPGSVTNLTLGVTETLVSASNETEKGQTTGKTKTGIIIVVAIVIITLIVYFVLRVRAKRRYLLFGY